MASALLTAPQLQALDERAARSSLRDQIARLERELIELEATAPVPSGGPRLLGLEQLEALRDSLAHRAAVARAKIAERTAEQEAYRVRIEEMLLDPDAHRWERVTNADIGEPAARASTFARAAASSGCSPAGGAS